MVKVVFIHPDLGIGGAERAVVDAALALKSRGHSVHFVTAHHSPDHCFEETRDGTFTVTVAGDWLPRSFIGRFYALCAYIRMIYAAFYLVFLSGIEYNIVFCDQISACIPVLKLKNQSKILFYCHFPDQLLTQRTSFLKKVYRKPIDWLEEKTTGLADVVLVNSKFTAGIFNETFSALQHIDPEVLYPIPDFSAFSKPTDPPADDLIPPNEVTFLSINRYERKKNLSLAMQALSCLKERMGTLQGVHLIMAGGYDDRVVENKEYYTELLQLADKLELGEHISFIKSFSDSQKRTLLKYCSCLLYTPDREHFGIVPIEAMYMECPVIAVNTGGPLETVEDGKTGFLCNQSPESFAIAMEKIVKKHSLKKKLGRAGHERVTTKFSFETFTAKLNRIILSLNE